MLVLSRKVQGKIFIGKDICITVVDIDRGRIRLGIDAPKDLLIYREELLPVAQQSAPEPPLTEQSFCPLNGDRS